jgi:putative pyruvate formate lyase activating enzyme
MEKDVDNINKENLRCEDCPRRCPLGKSFCGKDKNFVRVAKIMRHHYEEPIICPEEGSGAIFFSYCSLKCCFCQNYEISHLGCGRDFSVEELAKLFEKIEKSGVSNLNLVTPTHYTSKIIEALNLYKPKISVVWNTSGYERVENIEKLKNYVDIFLFDFKYYNPDLAMKYSKAKDYFEVCLNALKKAREIIPNDVFCDGVLKKGIIVRHLVLPNGYEDSLKILDAIEKSMGNKTIISLMSQFVPCYRAKEFEELQQHLPLLQYKKVVAHAKALGFKRGFVQEEASASCDYTPNFSAEKFEEL